MYEQKSYYKIFYELFTPFLRNNCVKIHNKLKMNNLEVKKIREKLGFTQQELANYLEVDIRTVQKWEAGDTKIRKANAFLLTQLLESRNKVVNENGNDILENTNGNKYSELNDGTFDVEVKMLPFKAYATYLESLETGTINTEYETTVFNVDKFGKGNYMAFVVKGDSMNGGKIDDTPDGAKVLGRELGRHLWKDGFYDSAYGWVIMCKQNIFHKDITDFCPEKGIITCHSRNDSPEYADFELYLNDVYQIFKVIKRIF